MATPTYNDIIRKLTLGFGNLFKDIQILRYNTDGTEAERFLVPIQYASKEKYVARLQGDPNLDRKIQVSLPSMSFEMNGITYDATRKQNTNVKNFVQNGSVINSQYNPVPYNLDFSLSIYVRNSEDGNQIIERILPYFTPDYTIKINLVPTMGVISDVPIVLNNVSYDNEYEGNFGSDTRIIIWTLNFTVKGSFYGNVSESGIIYHTITNIYNDITAEDQIQFNLTQTGVGEYQAGEIVYQGYSIGSATATAQVVSSDSLNNTITLQNINGNFVSSIPLIGMVTGTSNYYSSYNFITMKFAEIDSYANVSMDGTYVTMDQNATFDNSNTITTIITEY